MRLLADTHADVRAEAASLLKEMNLREFFQLENGKELTYHLLQDRVGASLLKETESATQLSLAEILKKLTHEGDYLSVAVAHALVRVDLNPKAKLSLTETIATSIPNEAEFLSALERAMTDSDPKIGSTALSAIEKIHAKYPDLANGRIHSDLFKLPDPKTETFSYKSMQKLRRLLCK